MFSSAYPYPKLEQFPPSPYKSKFVDYSSSHNNAPRHPSSLTMGELHLAALLDSKDTLQCSPHVKTSRMTDSPSGSESMDSSSVTEHCHPRGDRKRRRGVIEKKRRDRINNSLAELRRLVPSAFEKQGSTKLEKAEILQMTVDHLKTIHTKGINYASNGLDPHMLGFQECVAEIQRFIVQDEHFSAQDQLRSRLLSHLQCYTAQRETFKQTSHQTGAWLPASSQCYPTGPTGLVPPPPPVGLNCGVGGPGDSMVAPSCLGTSGMAYSTAPATSSSSSSSFSAQSPGQYAAFSAGPANHHMQSMYMAASSQANYAAAASRPYRPWGHEMVY